MCFKTQKITTLFGLAMLKEADQKLEQEEMPFPWPYDEIPRIQVQIEFEEKIMSLLREAGLGRIVLSHNDW